MSNIQRHVTVEGVRLRFAAAHMATLGDELEPLHGHNYSVRCRVEGDLTSDRWMIDFGVLKRALREACEVLDHHFLLQTKSRLLAATLADGAWTVRFGAGTAAREYRFPEADVAALPIENTTAELLAEWLADRVDEVLRAGDHANIVHIAVDVEEMPGQAGGYARDRG